MIILLENSGEASPPLDGAEQQHTARIPCIASASASLHPCMARGNYTALHDAVIRGAATQRVPFLYVAEQLHSHAYSLYSL